MAVTRPAAVVEDPRYREHVGPDGHPERPGRLVAVGEALAARGEPLLRLAPRPADDEELLRIHGRGHLELVAEAARRAPIHFDADTFCAPRSDEIARLAAGGSIELVRAVASGRVSTGLAAVRPPGHHAEADRAMGFCLYNNVAVAARALQAEGLERVMIFDWDVHHGNGTQHSFEDDPSVLYVSTHQFPYYPGTGGAGEAGVGRGQGATFNVPMPAGCGDAEYLGVAQRLVAPAAQAFRPDAILVSAGFDAHRDDPLASMQLSGAGFGALAAVVRELARELCQDRLAFVLEGGYAASGLREGVGAVLDAVLPEAPPAVPPSVEAPAGSMLRQIVDAVVSVHGRRVPGLGAV